MAPHADDRAGRTATDAHPHPGRRPGELRPAAGGTRFLHVLTTVHGLGAAACFVMAIGSGVSADFRRGLVVSGGSAVMVHFFGEWTWAFLTFVGAVLAFLAWSSWRLKPWAWHLTLLVYGIGVAGSLWQVSAGIRAGWISAAVNGAVVTYAARPVVRRAYRGR